MGMGPIRAQDTDDDFGASPLSEINVTPLVDVMLVLLIIFMVAAPLMTVGVPVQLPKTAAPKVSQPKQPVVVKWIILAATACMPECPTAASSRSWARSMPRASARCP